jgi:hypothetical protein
MVRAAENFIYSGSDDPADRQRFLQGEDVPASVAKDIPDHLILENVAKNNPDALTRDQLLIMAGVDREAAGVPEDAEFNEDDFREGLSNFKTKADLVEWANDALGMGLNEDDGKREELEDQIVGHAKTLGVQFETEEDE